MTPAVAALLADFESAAKAAQAAEAELRKAMAEQIARAERQRAFAFRRTRLIRTLADSIPGHATWAAQGQAVRDELGWTRNSESYDAIIAQLKPVADAVRECLCKVEGPPPAAVSDALVTFETWFEGEHGKSFYALFDQYVPEVPVVDY
jgi:hypothetical protein